MEPGKASLVRTRNEGRRAWSMVGDMLIRQRQLELAAHVRRFSEKMLPPQTKKEWIAHELFNRAREPHVQERLTVWRIVMKKIMSGAGI